MDENGILWCDSSARGSLRQIWVKQWQALGVMHVRSPVEEGKPRHVGRHEFRKEGTSCLHSQAAPVCQWFLDGQKRTWKDKSTVGLGSI